MKKIILTVVFILLFSSTAFAWNDNPSSYLGQSLEVKWSNTEDSIKFASTCKNVFYDLPFRETVWKYITDTFLYDWNKYNNLPYYPDTYYPNNGYTWRMKKGICYDTAALYAAMMRSQGIPCKLVKGYTVSSQAYHAWNEVWYPDKGWKIIDISTDLVWKEFGQPYVMFKEQSKYNKKKEG